MGKFKFINHVDFFGHDIEFHFGSKRNKKESGSKK